MIALAERLRDALTALIRDRGLAWCVTQIGARCEFQFSQRRPEPAARPKRPSTTAWKSAYTSHFLTGA